MAKKKKTTKKKLKPLQLKIHISIFKIGVDVHVCSPDEMKKRLEYMEKQTGNTFVLPDEVDGVTFELSGNFNPIMWLNTEEVESSDFFETLSHETCHAVNIILKMRGIPVSYDNTEVVAYLVGHIVKTVMKDVRWG